MLIQLNNVVNDIKNKRYWYFGNHSKDFVKACYIVELLGKLSADTTQSEMEKVRDQFNKQQDKVQIEAAMFKSMIMAKIYGLLDNSHKYYTRCKPTPVFDIIKKRTKGNFVDFHHYVDLYEQQVEKLFYITPFFAVKNKEEFELYPLLFLYKIIMLAGESTGTYQISQDEFRYFVATARVYNDWKDVVETILYYRKKPTGFMQDLCLLMKADEVSPPDQRFCQIIQEVPKLTISTKFIKIKDEFLHEVKNKVSIFEMINKIPPQNPGAFPNGLRDFENYVEFLGGNYPLLPKSSRYNMKGINI